MTHSTLKTVRLVLWGMVCVAALWAGWTWYGSLSTPAPASVTQRLAEAQDGQYGAGDYRLVTHTGEDVDDTIFVGKPSLVFFGFTHCPDVCPTTLADIEYWFTELGGDANDMQAFFVTADPERDTVEVMAEYVGWFSERIIGLTGEPEEIAEMIDAWGVFTQRTDLEGGGYNVDHTASVFMLDSGGRFFGTISYEENSETAIAKVRRLADAG
ncbi:SCO family protein [Pelagibacterium halotolerans]|jgi:protein SCO1|uniref:Cytochrome oxidase biogenesis protein Sco1/SenC/PrrC, putative copper metallochaperone n=1 Tax=Pelagibacterium halotolerans (strain DSM 22347 / JCM 15775 / CGMCC 1.7692 / B2) TaxID=1082931 RepID=G4RDM7_PELHB|nr:SCO family protein [Pelagibacterium halotolerans]AEQ52813.1 cytochrome oxidase biogenesis protein Sco1/SenC/PrrC, putative copper metallochaperone [Pelagibacterium halotolerans B2]QJR17497.1 SCO family protein [Pelagibacterium halotolerans]SEA75598.1 protein SCO1/2 [Pelagibacterium halotolerans]